MIKILTIEIVCKDYETDHVLKEFYNSHIAQQLMLYSFGGTTRDLTKDELQEVKAQIPKDIFEDAMEK